MKYYDEWGEGNKYDKDMVDWNYTGPKETTKFLLNTKRIKMQKFMMLMWNGISWC